MASAEGDEPGEALEEVAVHSAAALAAGDLVVGPAIIEAQFTSIFVSANRDARVDGANNIVLVTKPS